jgi:hypothetical protein
MVTKNEVEGVRQELRSLVNERVKLAKEQQSELDRFNHQWAVKLRQVKIEGTDRIKPFWAEKDTACNSITDTLSTKLFLLDEARRGAIKLAEEKYKQDMKLARQDAERQLSEKRQEFEKQSKKLATQLKEEESSCEKERDEAFEKLKVEQEKAMMALKERAAELEKKMATWGSHEQGGARRAS